MSESEYVDRTPLDDPAWVIALVEERDALRARVRELEGEALALRLHSGKMESVLRRYVEMVEECGPICRCGGAAHNRAEASLYRSARALLPAPAPGRDTAGPGTTTGGTDAA